MIPQLAVIGRSGGRSFARGTRSRKLHTDASVNAKAAKSGEAQKVELPVITATFDELLAEQIEAYPHKDTYDSATEDLKVTTQELRAHAYGLTGGIHEYRTKARKSYAAATGLRIEPLIGLLGAPKAGKLFAAIPPFRTEQMISDLNKTSAQFFLWSPKIGKTNQLDDIYKVFEKLLAMSPETFGPVSDARVPNLQFVVHTAKRVLNGMVFHRDLLAYHYYESQIKPSEIIGANEVSTLVFHGEEIAALSQSNIINTANSLGHALGLTGAHTTLNGLLPDSAAGLVAGFMLPIVRRSKLVVSSDVPHSDVPRVHDAIAQHGVNTVVGDAQLWSSILSSSVPAQTKAFAEAIKTGVIVGNNKPVEESLVQAIQKTLGVAKVHVSQGSALTSGVALVDGQAIANTQVKLVDKAGKDTTGSGFLAVKGINVFKGIYKNGSVDASSVKADGFVLTDIKAKQETASTFSVIN